MKRFTLLFLFASIVFLSGCTGDKATYALIETEYGNMKIRLYDSTPLHRDNFVKLANEGFYKDLLFHRIIKGFMVQGGDPDSKNASPEQRLGGGGPGYRVPAEIGRPHIKGALAAARTGGAGNPEKESSGSQFYLVQGNPISDAQLDATEKQKNIKYNEAQRKLYKELGGAIALDMDYTVYGEIVEGLDVLDKIAAVPTKPGDRPVQDVKMNVTIVN